MISGLSTRLFVENGPTDLAMRQQATHSAARSWHILNPDRRLTLVERALRPSNDEIDSFPPAL